ncbi:MAG: hypothetical protein EXR91_05650 [Gemmatimonadetes bacterium]|nr:hypothetical protein [Gemmatimonadota bacterium]
MPAHPKPKIEATSTDLVAIDAKRILLRYGAPIAVLDKVSVAHRIEFAREIAKTVLPQREERLRELLVEGGYVDASANPKKRRRQAAP